MAPAPKPKPMPACVLVVEDEVLIRLVIADELRADGFSVIEAASADQALSYLQAGVPIDLVLSDIEMPGSMNGLGLIQRLRVQAPNLPTVLTSGASPVAHDADAFVSKPYDMRQLVALIAGLLHRETRMNQPCLLLGDGEELVRAPLAQYLRECGYRVLEAVNAKEARAILSDGSEVVDIMLADIQTLGEEGFAFVAWARKNKPGIRIVSAGTVAATARKAGDLCEEEPPIRKPYDHQMVLDRIRRLLAERDRNRK
jgi:DNA-binding response OmpR family regulator